jgi:hypothetical protein
MNSQSFNGSGWPTQEIRIIRNQSASLEVHTIETERSEVSEAVWEKLLSWD